MLSTATIRRTRILLYALPAAVLVGLVAFAGAAGAATKNGIKPKAPKAGATVPAGTSPTFRMKVTGAGGVWVHVCKSKRRDGDGVICSDEAIGQARKKKGEHRFTPRFFDYPAFWLNSPGTYYWQAHRIACEGGDASDCRQEGPIVRFKVG